MRIIGIILLLLTGCAEYQDDVERQSPADGPYTNVDDANNDPRCTYGNGFTVNSRVVCSQGRLVSENPNEFKILSENYGIDSKTNIAHHIYGILVGSDAASFEVLSYYSAKDKGQAYVGSETVKGADAPTFVYIYSTINKDKNHVYRFGRTLPTADAATFNKIVQIRPLADNRAQWTTYFKDATKVFDIEGRDLVADRKFAASINPAEFLHYGGWYVKTNGAVYFDGTPLPSINPDTFQFLDCSASKVADPAGTLLDAPSRREHFCYGLADGQIIENSIFL